LEELFLCHFRGAEESEEGESESSEGDIKKPHLQRGPFYDIFLISFAFSKDFS